MRYSEPLRRSVPFIFQEPEQTADSSTVKDTSPPAVPLVYTRPLVMSAVGSVEKKRFQAGHEKHADRDHLETLLMTSEYIN